MQFATGYENRRARIEIVPLIDVVFLLLVFFIYAMLSMTVYRGLRVALPSGVGETENLETLVIAIADDNTLWIDQVPVSLPEAVARASAHGSATPTPVLISGDQRAELGISITLLSALRQAGIESVSFQVKAEE